MELHACLWNDVSAFDFSEDDLAPIANQFPQLTIKTHRDVESFLSSASKAQIVLTWDFPAQWYALCPDLELVLTPAAGADWVEPDPKGQVPLIQGSFHGEILAESLLSAILFMNHRMPAMIENFSTRGWDRNLQRESVLVGRQTVLIIGLGNIGRHSARLIGATGARVIGVRRTKNGPGDDVETHAVDDLPELLPQADHVVLLLPGTEDTDRFMSSDRLALCKPGAYIYNFGRGNALYSEDLIASWDRFAGAFLDVTDEEPLPPDSPLWQLDNIMITPHSSCVYDDYRRLFVEEVIDRLDAHFEL